MFSDLDDAFEDTGAIRTLVPQCCLPLSEQQLQTAGSLNNSTQAENTVEATTTTTTTTATTTTVSQAQ